MSQTTQILNHLKRWPITPLQAQQKFGCMSLAARISDLRNKGHRIETEWVRQGNKRFAKYWLKR